MNYIEYVKSALKAIKNNDINIGDFLSNINDLLNNIFPPAMLVRLITDEINLSTKIKRGDYEFLNDPDKSWYDHSFNPTKHGIEYYQTIKIRMLMQYIHGRRGYPVRFAHGITFDSGLGIWVPAMYAVDLYETIKSWIADKGRAWRICKIRFQGSDRLRQLLQMIPFNIGEVLDVFTAENSEDYRVATPMRNISFANTLNDAVIMANWDHIRNYLDEPKNDNMVYKFLKIGISDQPIDIPFDDDRYIL